MPASSETEFVESLRSRQTESSIGDFERADVHPILINELVGEMHDIVVHSVLLRELHDGIWMGGSESFK